MNEETALQDNWRLLSVHLAVGLTWTKAQIRGDSQLVLQRMQGIAQVRHTNLQPHYATARKLTQTLTCVWEHTPREWNTAADYLSKLAPDDQKNYESPTNPLTPQPYDKLYATCLAISLLYLS